MKTLEQRLWEKVAPAPAEACWMWTASTDERGYGKIHVGGVGMVRAYRVAFELLIAEVPAGLELDHLCRVHGCVNPWHLDPVPHLVNVRRGISGEVNGARRRAVTACKRGHPFSPENTRIARDGSRVCRTCDRERKAA